LREEKVNRRKEIREGRIDRGWRRRERGVRREDRA